MFKKNKLFKTLKILTSFIFIFGIFCTTMCKAHWELIELPTGNVLKINDVKPGKLNAEIRAVPSMEEYEHIIVTGEMKDFDFEMLSTYKYKSVDLSGVRVDKMPEQIFFQNNYIEKFVCPANLKIMKKKSFMMCHNLKTVIFPKSLESIGPHCFYFCIKLETPLPLRVKFGAFAFYKTLNDPWIDAKEKMDALPNKLFKIKA